MKIGRLETDHRVVVVAEIGNNHEGDEALAHRLIWLAAENGADAVKFQCISPAHLGNTPERRAQLERICLPWDAFRRLAETAQNNDVEFLCTPFNVAAVEWLDILVPAWKVAARSCNDIELLTAIGETGKPVIMSVPAGKDHVVPKGDVMYLHVVPEYPTPHKQANLQRVRPLYGYSDHTLGIEAAVGAVYRGARLIEKHFTIDKQRTTFRDHALSADPDDLRELVRRVRLAEHHLA